MTRTDHLLFILAEECAEVAQRASKAARFGLAEVQPGQELTNAQRIGVELNDLMGVISMLVDEGAFAGNWMSWKAAENKMRKVEDYLAYSAECGTLDIHDEKGDSDA